MCRVTVIVVVLCCILEAHIGRIRSTNFELWRCSAARELGFHRTYMLYRAVYAFLVTLERSINQVLQQATVCVLLMNYWQWHHCKYLGYISSSM